MGSVFLIAGVTGIVLLMFSVFFDGLLDAFVFDDLIAVLSVFLCSFSASGLVAEQFSQGSNATFIIVSFIVGIFVATLFKMFMMFFRKHGEQVAKDDDPSIFNGKEVRIVWWSNSEGKGEVSLIENPTRHFTAEASDFYQTGDNAVIKEAKDLRNVLISKN